MKRQVILCTIIMLVLLPAALVIGCQQPAPAPPAPAPTPPPAPPPPPPPPTPETLTYTNSEYGFSCDYPKDWDVEEDLAGVVVAFAGPLAGEYDYMVNINIVTEELTSKMTVEDYGRMGELHLKKAWPDYVNVHEYTTTISGLPAIVRTVTATVTDFPLKDIQAFLIKDKVAYIITYDVTVDSHDEYADCFELVISTFKFETPPPPPPPPTPQTLTYTNSDYGFSCDYPGDWDVMENYMGTVVLFGGPMVLEGAYMVNVSVQVTELPRKVTVEDLVKMGELQEKKQYANYSKLGEQSTTIGGQPAIVTTITCTIKVSGVDVPLKDKVARLIKDKVAYIISYDVPEESHDEYLDCFELVISSFKFE